MCDALNTEGVATRFGKVWMPMTVQRIAGALIASYTGPLLLVRGVAAVGREVLRQGSTWQGG